jgi:hypothetical protein
MIPFECFRSGYTSNRKHAFQHHQFLRAKSRLLSFPGRISKSSQLVSKAHEDVFITDLSRDY